jgi:hypothetical protein
VDGPGDGGSISGSCAWQMATQKKIALFIL